MINLEKIKWGKCQPPPPFKETCPGTILLLPFFDCSLSTSGGGNQHSLPPSFKKKGGGGSELCEEK